MPPRPPLLRIPYTDPLPPPLIIPSSASTIEGAISALISFLHPSIPSRKKTLILSGAGLSTASGLADYRGAEGTYTLNKSYKPVFFKEFCESHEARRRYWARSFLGWAGTMTKKPNPGHMAVADLGVVGAVGRVITQNVDSFHAQSHPSLPTISLHGTLSTTTCLTCHTLYPRAAFQEDLEALNPTWGNFLARLLSSGALSTEDPSLRAQKGLRTNPDGDVDIGNEMSYHTFNYPSCPSCGTGVLKPSVVMFGESIPRETKDAAEKAIDGAGRVLVVGSSLATYSAWRLVRRARERGLPIGILNLGGVRGEEGFFDGVGREVGKPGKEVGGTGEKGMRCSEKADLVLPEVVRRLKVMARTGDTR